MVKALKKPNPEALSSEWTQQSKTALEQIGAASARSE
jgi:hypothetical protein